MGGVAVVLNLKGGVGDEGVAKWVLQSKKCGKIKPRFVSISHLSVRTDFFFSI